jgi:hypothetical protein
MPGGPRYRHGYVVRSVDRGQHLDRVIAAAMRPEHTTRLGRRLTYADQHEGADCDGVLDVGLTEGGRTAFSDECAGTAVDAVTVECV